MDSIVIGLDRLDKAWQYNLGIKNNLLKICLSFLFSSFLKFVHSNLSISINILNEGIERPIRLHLIYHYFFAAAADIESVIMLRECNSFQLTVHVTWFIECERVNNSILTVFSFFS